MGMDHVYEARATTPGQTLSVHIENTPDEGAPAFDATLSLARRELTAQSARQLTTRYPFATLRVLALIYGHAVGLKLAGARVFPHPKPGTRCIRRRDLPAGSPAGCSAGSGSEP